MHILTNADMFVGKTVEVKFAKTMDAEVFRAFIPCRIIKECKKFWVVETLPHKNPIRSYGVSKPYRMTLLKWDVDTKNTVVKEVYHD